MAQSGQIMWVLWLCLAPWSLAPIIIVVLKGLRGNLWEGATIAVAALVLPPLILVAWGLTHSSATENESLGFLFVAGPLLFFVAPIVLLIVVIASHRSRGGSGSDGP